MPATEISETQQYEENDPPKSVRTITFSGQCCGESCWLVNGVAYLLSTEEGML